jgi:hypothetical protein
MGRSIIRAADDRVGSKRLSERQHIHEAARTPPVAFGDTLPIKGRKGADEIPLTTPAAE